MHRFQKQVLRDFKSSVVDTYFRSMRLGQATSIEFDTKHFGSKVPATGYLREKKAVVQSHSSYPFTDTKDLFVKAVHWTRMSNEARISMFISRLKIDLRSDAHCGLTPDNTAVVWSRNLVMRF